MKRFVFPLAVTLCFLTFVSTVSAKDTWISMRTKNFSLVGNASEKDIRKVALKLEQFRAVLTRLLPHLKINTPVPTTVVVFKNKSSYAPFGPPGSSGYFQSGPDVNYIALSAETHRGQDGVLNIIFHEYTHLIVNNTVKNAPLWFNEGLAEYYSTFSITDDEKFSLGYPIGNHVLFLRETQMLPLQTLFEVTHHSPQYNEKSKKSIFYAQSWALVHYLVMGKDGQLKKLAKFIEMIAAGVPVETAFPQAFETTFDAMEKELRDYVKKNRYNYVKDHLAQKLELDTTAEAKALTEAEAQAYLGDLLLHTNDLDAAAKYLENALKLDPDLAMAHASLGMLLFRKGRPDEARASLERAVAASPQNYLTHYYYAYTLSRRRPEEMSASNYTPEQVVKIREHLKRAIELRPDFPDSHNLMAYVSLISGEQVDESMASIKRILSASPGRVDSTFMLGQLYMRKHDYKTARPLLEQVAKSNGNEAQMAQRMLARLTNYEKELAEYEESLKKSRQGSGIVADTVVVQTSDPWASLREALRKPRNGETQIMVTLVRIECNVKNIVFVVQTPTGLLRLRTNSFTDVEIVTFTADVAGDISCGPRKPVNAVVVNYIPNTDKRLKIDGILKSVEFVPNDFKLKPEKF